MDLDQIETIDFELEDVLKTALTGMLDSLQVAYLGKLGVTVTPDIRERISMMSLRQVNKLFD